MADKITSVVARESNGNIQITFTIPYSLVKKAEDETVEEMAKDIEIPGFRKGKAPAAKAREKIPENQLIEHALSHLLPKALADSVEENKLKIAVYPKFELISAENDKPWQIRGITCELPAFELGDYKNVIGGEIRAASLKKELTKEEKEQVVVKALVESTKIEIPQILIEEEADSRISNLLNRLEKLGLALESYLASINKKAEDLRAEYAQQARSAIALDLILSKVAEAESIKVSEKEINEAYNMSQASKTEKTAEVSEERQKSLLESILRRRQALDFLTNLG